MDIKLDTIMTCKEVSNKVLKSTLQIRSAVYIFFNVNMDALYVGYSGSIPERVRTHINGTSNVKFIEKPMYVGFVHKITDFLNINTDCNDVEYYVIDKLKPSLNKRCCINLAYKEI